MRYAFRMIFFVEVVLDLSFLEMNAFFLEFGSSLIQTTDKTVYNQIVYAERRNLSFGSILSLFS